MTIFILPLLFHCFHNKSQYFITQAVRQSDNVGIVLLHRSVVDRCGVDLDIMGQHRDRIPVTVSAHSVDMSVRANCPRLFGWQLEESSRSSFSKKGSAPSCPQCPPARYANFRGGRVPHSDVSGPNSHSRPSDFGLTRFRLP